MVQTPGYFSSAALVSVGARAHYIASAAHYEVVARRIVAALRDGDRPMVLVTGEPPADPEVLSEALGDVAGPGHGVVIISCGPELKPADLERAVAKLAKPKAGGVGADPGRSASTSPLFIFEGFDRLSDGQIVDVYEGTQRRDRIPRAAVLLAPVDFHARLERPALQCLKQCIAAQFRFEEVGDDEAIAVLHEQLLAQRDRRVEARGFRRGILIGSAAGGVAIVASIGVFMLRSTTEQVYESPANIGRSNSTRAEAPLLPGARTGKEHRDGASPPEGRDGVSASGGTATSSRSGPHDSTAIVAHRDTAAFPRPAITTNECRKSARRHPSWSGTSPSRTSPFSHGDQRPGRAWRRVPRHRRYHLGTRLF